MGFLDDDLLADGRALAQVYRWFADGLRVRLGTVSYSATESWVMFELARQDAVAVAALRRRLGIDPGYLSRVLSRFQADRLVTRQRAVSDGRCRTVRLTERGHAVSRAIDAHAAEVVRTRLTGLGEHDRRRICAAMVEIRQAIDSYQGGPRAV